MPKMRKKKLAEKGSDKRRIRHTKAPTLSSSTAGSGNTREREKGIRFLIKKTSNKTEKQLQVAEMQAEVGGKKRFLHYDPFARR